MPEAWRLFVGIELDDTWTSLLDETAHGLRSRLGDGVRWVRPDLYHVTLVFLGGQPPDGISAIGETLDAASATVEPFSLSLTHLRRLGSHEHGALVAAVDDPTGRLQVLRSAVDGALREHGIRFDTKPLVPHITLARPGRKSGPLDAPPLSLSEAAPLQVEQIALIKSDLLPEGPRYQPIHVAPLGQP